MAQYLSPKAKVLTRNTGQMANCFTIFWGRLQPKDFDEEQALCVKSAGFMPFARNCPENANYNNDTSFRRSPKKFDISPEGNETRASNYHLETI
ncbi:hypothetical protein CEXT_240411 [Caerostris extrusa]|uniref:Uncharacterized protein n=1 Tax=Caerostris extrusa TaxID=172846 RepID=A0AAV4XM47_CAEEX|nr:hypothetical protein CEXT_240411 [Caerostris extrusa]